MENITKYLSTLFFLLFFLFSSIIFSDEIKKKITIVGNDNIDDEVIFSIIGDKLTDYSQDSLNKIIKTLYNTGNFQKIEIENLSNELIIKIIEFPSIDNVKFLNLERFEEEEIFEILNKDKESYFLNYNEAVINEFIDNLKDIYASFGYNNINIDYYTIESSNKNNFIDLIFDISEGEISKINKIYFSGNESYSNFKLKRKIKSKQRNFLRYLSGSTNFKKFQIENDRIKLINFYKDNGFKDISINYKIEFIEASNKFNIYFFINEGKLFKYQNIILNLDKLKIDNEEKLNLIEEQNKFIAKKLNKDNTFNLSFLEKIVEDLTIKIYTYGVIFFEIDISDRIFDDQVEILLSFNEVNPKYVDQINITGNTRTKDKVIRREIAFAEGDPVNDNLLNKSSKNIRNLGIFQDVELLDVSKEANNENIDINIDVEEKSTGQFQVGLTLDSYEGAVFVAGLSERNILGDGRKLDLTINTSNKNTKYNLGVTEPYIFNNKMDLLYGVNFSRRDYSTSSSYKIDSFMSNLGVEYSLTDDIDHLVELAYSLKDYKVTDSSKVSDIIKKQEGNNADILLNNKLGYNSLDSRIRPTKGTYVNYLNTITPITNNENGYIKNVFQYHKYYSFNKDSTFSFKTRIGNITSFQNAELATDDKFSLGGRWLRGFDVYGAGPRKSRTSYIGGKNIITTKFDYNRPISGTSDNPIDLNLFVDAGTVFDNKVDPANSEESIRSAYGFGIKFYSPIGPIGLSWAFPISSESYDIERMFAFSIGNLN